jgi:hypothetical protein
VTGKAPSASGGPAFSEFGFVCTDKGQHRRYPLLRAMLRPESDDLIRWLSTHPSVLLGVNRPLGLRITTSSTAPGAAGTPASCTKSSWRPSVNSRKLEPLS